MDREVHDIGYDTIFALSSGALPAAIAIFRISGPGAEKAFALLGAQVPQPRRPSLLKLVDPDDEGLLDEALCLFFPGPNSATGENLVEFHCHGSRAVISRLADLLGRLPGFREAEAGEFTRRAFANNRIDLNQADGLAELIEAEDERSRKFAATMYSGAFSSRLESWTDRLLALSAQIETQLDFSDEDDVSDEAVDGLHANVKSLRADIAALLQAPMAERMGEGIRVVIAGPPNSGKSTLLNALAGREAAIVSDIEGTTRDLIEVPLRLNGQPFLFIDSAGLRDEAGDAIEAIGIERAMASAAASDILLWLGPEGAGPHLSLALEIAPKTDSADFVPKGDGSISLSAATGEGMEELKVRLLSLSASLSGGEGEFALNRRQRNALQILTDALDRATMTGDLIIMAEELRGARLAIDRLTGKAATEDMLDSLFNRFCIGK